MFNPFAPGFFEDPYPHYAELREQDPVHRSLIGPWILTRYEDVVPVLRDPTLSVEDRNAVALAVDPEIAAVFEGRDGGDRAMLNLDPPDHDRLRRLVSKAFTPKMIESLRPEVERLVDLALDEVVARGTGEMDLIADLAFPLPFTVISEMLGMPTERRDELRTWSHALVKTLDPDHHASTKPGPRRTAPKRCGSTCSRSSRRSGAHRPTICSRGSSPPRRTATRSTSRS